MTTHSLFSILDKIEELELKTIEEKTKELEKLMEEMFKKW